MTTTNNVGAFAQELYAMAQASHNHEPAWMLLIYDPLSGRTTMSHSTGLPETVSLAMLREVHDGILASQAPAPAPQQPTVPVQPAPAVVNPVGPAPVTQAVATWPAGTPEDRWESDDEDPEADIPKGDVVMEAGGRQRTPAEQAELAALVEAATRLGVAIIA